MGRTRLYRDGELVKENFPLAEISDCLKDPSALVWLDVHISQHKEVEAIHEELGLHRLAVEDALQPHERAKLDRYPSHLFLSCYSGKLDTESGELQLSEVSAFIVHNALVTVHGDDGFDMDDVVRRWDAEPELSRYGVGYLVHGLIDYVVDTQLSVVEAIDDQLESLEVMLFDDRPTDREVQRRTFEVRKSLLHLRRVVLPMREAILALQRRDLVAIHDELGPYFQDVYDHVLRSIEWMDSLRELVTTVFETNLNARSNRLTTITKQVTSWAAIIAVPTAITGFYGQNVLFPGYGQKIGFWVSSLVTLGLSGLLYITFKRKGWL
jgi:magnesium transporter